MPGVPQKLRYTERSMAEADDEFEHLPNAPIREAIIDFRTKPLEAFDPAVFRTLKPTLQTEFPTMEDLSQLRYRFQYQGGKPTSPPEEKNMGLHGVVFHSADGKSVAQFRRNGFTFNRLKPYTSWGDVFEKASRLWRLYSKTAGATEVTRIATRYVNRLELPGDHPLEHYLQIRTDIPKEWPRVMSGFLMKLVLEDASGVKANIALALEEPPQQAYIPMIFDIDVFREVAEDIGADALLDRFSELRAMKNRVFFNGLTKDAIALFR
jgi:uncharacterized protein (TIGR04255 family)